MKIHINSNKLVVYPTHVNIDELNFLSKTMRNNSFLSYSIDDMSRMHIVGNSSELFRLLYELSKDFDVELI